MKQGNYHILPSPSANSCKAAAGRCATAQPSPAPQEGTHAGPAARSTSARSQRFQPGRSATEHEANAGSEPSGQPAPPHPAVPAEQQPGLIPAAPASLRRCREGLRAPSAISSRNRGKAFSFFWTNCHLPRLFPHRFVSVSLATSTSSNTGAPGQLCRGRHGSRCHQCKR